MALFVVGISHKTAPVELREKLCFSAAEVEGVLGRIRNGSPLSESTVLSTCNRTEIYGVSDDHARDWCVKFLSDHFGRADLEPYLYFKKDQDMIAHLFRVAAGLDSMVFGENEILKQVKDAYQASHRLGLTEKLLNVLFQRALYVGKMVRTHTLINQGAVSVGSVAVSLAEKIFGDLSKSSILIFGAGKMAEVSARHLLSKKVKRLLVANRTVEKAQALADRFKAKALSIEEGLAGMVQADVVITSMSSTEPLIRRGFMNEVMAKRHYRSLFLIDIAVPRNIDPEVHRMDNVYLYNIDDLESIVRENIDHRGAEIEKASRIVSQKSVEIYDWVRSLESGAEKSLKHHMESVRDRVV